MSTKKYFKKCDGAKEFIRDKLRRFVVMNNYQWKM